MNRLLSAALLSCAAASLSNPAWSFQGFDFFEQIEHSIECVRKPGTDYLLCTYKPVEEEEEVEEELDTSDEAEPELVNPHLFPVETYDAPLATDSEMDYVWAETQAFTIDMTPLENKLQFGDSCDEVFQQIFPESINDDEYQDFMLQIECKMDELYEGKSMKDYWQAGYIAESFIVFACGSDQGLYNCTEEFTGHKDVFSMAPDEWPGAFGYGQPALLYDFNGDGVKDIFMNSQNDTDDRADYFKWDFSEPIFDRYYDLWGKPYEECKFQRGPELGCWYMKAVQTFAISSPNGHVLKKLKWPGKFDLPHDTNIWHTEDGEIHLMYDKFQQGQEMWFTWNPETEDFDYVSSYDDDFAVEPPLDYREGWTSADVIYRNNAIHHDWIDHNGAQYKVTDTDYSRILTSTGHETYEYCIREDITDFDYDICQRDQIYVIAKTESGLENFIEYRPLELATQARVTRANFGQTLSMEQKEDFFSILLHDYWITYDPKRSVSGKLVQLEDRPDADWYLVVNFAIQADMTGPGLSHVDEFLSETAIECSTGYECLYNESNIVFKYKVDFENQELIYEGTLLEYPFIWKSGTANIFNFQDHNGDGWKDLSISAETFNLWHVSNEYGELNFVDLQKAEPQDHNHRPSDIWMDFNNDGNVDYIQLNQHGSYKVYESTIDVDFTAENLWEVTPTLNVRELEDRISNCLVEDDEGNLMIPGGGRAFGCYRTWPSQQ